MNSGNLTRRQLNQTIFTEEPMSETFASIQKISDKLAKLLRSTALDEVDA